jgi:uncharacterized surface protein with fasciclin (FAS1) repeats
MPPPTFPIVEATPTTFGIFSLGLYKTGLFKTLSEKPRTGGTLFAPSNAAFQKLGPHINGFLFSKFGTKYLKALLQYHVVLNSTLYSDAFYKSEEMDATGFSHLDLQTELEGHAIPVDVKSWGHIIRITVNGVGVIYSDAPTKDGVIHVVNRVLIPPRKHSHEAGRSSIEDSDEEWDLDEFKERLDPLVEHISDDEVNEDVIDEEEFKDADDIPSAWSKMYL